MRAAGSGIDLQPLFVGQSTREERVDGDGRSTPGATVIAGLLEDDFAGTTVRAVNAGDVGVTVQVVADPRIPLTELTREILHAEDGKLFAPIAGTIKALCVRAIVVV